MIWGASTLRKNTVRWIMKAFWQKNDRSVVSLFIIGLAVFFVLASYRGVEATTLYIVPPR